MELREIPEVKTLIDGLVSALDVESILCYGSYAAGLQDEKSDIDLLIIVQQLPQKSQLQELYKSLKGFKSSESHDLEHWGTSWTLLNSKLETNRGLKIDLGYNTTAWLKKIVKKMIEKHEVAFKELPFRPYTFLGLLEHSQCLYDKHRLISKLKSKIRPFPIELKRKIVDANLPMLRDNYQDLVDNIERNIGLLAYQFNIFMGLDAALQLLWVINDVYDPASKRCESYLFQLKKLPEGFGDFINNSLPDSYKKRKEFVEDFGRIKGYLERSISELGLLNCN